MRPPKEMTDAELKDQFRYTWPAACENEAEYMEAACALADELLRRGYVARVGQFLDALDWTRGTVH